MSRKTLEASKSSYASIYVLECVVGMLESGIPSEISRTAEKIIRICKAEQQKQLVKTDRADELLGMPYGSKS